MLSVEDASLALTEIRDGKLVSSLSCPVALLTRFFPTPDVRLRPSVFRFRKTAARLRRIEGACDLGTDSAVEPLHIARSPDHFYDFGFFGF